MGVILGSAVIPIALAVTWSRANRLGCIAGSLIGLAAGLAAWLGTTSGLNDGNITVTTSGGDYEMLAGNLASILVGGAVAIGASVVWPENYGFEETRAMNAPKGSIFTLAAAAHQDDQASEKREEMDEKREATVDEARSVKGVDGQEHTHEGPDESELEPTSLERAFRFAWWASVVLVSSCQPSPNDFRLMMYCRPWSC
jgi:hypothetical protein